ncbi:hypothetical protein ACFTSD_01475 [Nocardiaceae bacterium NPDC056970]
MTDQFFIPRADMQELARLLREIPALVEDLVVTLTRQDRVGAPGLRVAKGSDEQPLPINLAASDSHELLHSTVTAWVRHVCEYRAIAYGGPLGTAGVARWLADHVTGLAMTEGCEDALDEIRYAMGECRRACDGPEDRAVLCIDPVLIPVLGRLELSASDCVATAKAAGIRLTKRRIDYLGEIRPWIRLRKDDGEWMYRLGDVLSANGTPLRSDLGREIHVLS